MKKIIISKLFLYRYRFVIGYLILGLAFAVLLFILPIIAQNGLSTAEMESATNSYYLGHSGITNGDLIDLPYRLLQKFSIMIFGLSVYSIKLPSIIIGLALGFLLILLLNRWFKNNVSLLASCLIILSTPFLFLAGSGTPLIMLIFWPTLLLWLGSKIQGEKRPKPLYSFIFGIAMLLSIFTPYMLYFAIFCVVFVLCQPHLRFIVKTLPKLLLVLEILIIILGISILAVNIYQHPNTIIGLLFSANFSIESFFPNIFNGFAPVFSWHSTIESVFLSPLISLPILALTLIGLFSTTKGFFASRNSIATILIIFCIIITGFNPNAAIFIILPFSILIAHGLKYILEKWYGLFPENPYARVSAIIPLAILYGVVIVPGLLQYIYGYRYNPNIANEFSYNLEVINKNLHEGTFVVTKNFNFYKILEDSTNLNIISEVPNGEEDFAVLGKLDNNNYKINQIITSPMRENSDIIYLYTVKKGE